MNKLEELKSAAYAASAAYATAGSAFDAASAAYATAGSAFDSAYAAYKAEQKKQAKEETK